MGQTLTKILSLSCLLVLAPALTAGPSLYPQPVTPRFEEGDDQLTCRELEQQLSSLSRQTYSDKPGFYDDPYHGASIWAGTLWAPGAWGYLAYSGTAEYTEHARVHEAASRIEALRHLKARRRCYE
ncbi:MAG: hypothetical protein KZQ73_11765 [Candidatus Thiodiazotropha sp. (ex Semelilucina semeliformis)]|nr:hypothetical protein [Candidatus Thiodiazotropha sp. (ex Myrtea spinifera)]MCU7808527.1 hypothetical protein [Candidatus Thiodiazotropha sp. (ex Semelilucina semeliformis)]MCU7829334.1 hypothetical protein [Candidatus Thiodiazotropha sp. (ex Myrtea sp. 'scaly one' KF741663)]